MAEHRFQDVWKEQCAAASGVRERHGVVAAPDYLVGEKLMMFAETTKRRPEFARELPRFVSAIRALFSAEEIRLYLDHLERMQVIAEEKRADAPSEDDDLFETKEDRAAARERLARLKALLTSSVLGTA
jgi:hypothetical protein